MFNVGDRVRIKNNQSDFFGSEATVLEVFGNNLSLNVDDSLFSAMAFRDTEVQPVIDKSTTTGYIRPSGRGGSRVEDKVAVIFEELLDSIEAGTFHRGDYTEYGLAYKVLVAIKEDMR